MGKSARWTMALCGIFFAGCGGSPDAESEGATSNVGQAMVSKASWSSIGCASGHFDGVSTLTCYRLSPNSPLSKGVDVRAHSAEGVEAKRSAMLVSVDPQIAVYEGNLLDIVDSLPDSSLRIASDRKTPPPRIVYEAYDVKACLVGSCW